MAGKLRDAPYYELKIKQLKARIEKANRSLACNLTSLKTVDPLHPIVIEFEEMFKRYSVVLK